MSETPEIVKTGVAVEPMESWNCLVVLTDALSETRTVKVEFPTADGVPPIAPLEGFRVSPGGRDPEVKDHVYGAIPPEAASV